MWIAVEKYLSENDKKHHLYRRVFQALGFSKKCHGGGDAHNGYVVRDHGTSHWKRS